MASESKNSKPDTTPSKADTTPKPDATTVKHAPAEAAAKPAAGETAAAAPANYSRGEGQKPVTAAYRENWNAIFAKKRKKKKR